MTNGPENRQHIFERLRTQPNLSVLIVGAGINGAGLYRDLALQGVNVLLIDKGDFCSGGSSAPSRMIHGGLRYLENGEFRLVQESLKERNLLLKNAPHYVFPLKTTVPIFDWFSGVVHAVKRFLRLSEAPNKRGALIIKIGLMFYDFFTRKQQIMPKHFFQSKAKSLKECSHMNENIVCTATYYDAWISHPERLCLELITDMEESYPNANALNYVSLVNYEDGKVLLKDEISGETIGVQPDLLVNATGGWIDLTNQSLNKPTQFIGGTKGSHLIIDNNDLKEATKGRMTYYENSEGRVCILFPYFNNVLVGSTDINVDNPNGVKCEEDEITYIIESIKHVFPKIKILRSEIVFTFSGVRPLPQSSTGVNGQISRDHSCEVIPANSEIAFPIYSMIGGKWTTFRAFSESVADKILDALKTPRIVQTENISIGGGKNFPQSQREIDNWFGNIEENTTFSRKRLKSLFERYGTHSKKIIQYIKQNDKPLQFHQDYTYQEIEFIIKNESVQHLDDLLLRRVSLALQGELSLSLISELNEILGKTLNWSFIQIEKEYQRTLDLLEKNNGLTHQKLNKNNHTKR